MTHESQPQIFDLPENTGAHKTKTLDLSVSHLCSCQALRYGYLGLVYPQHTTIKSEDIIMTLSTINFTKTPTREPDNHYTSQSRHTPPNRWTQWCCSLALCLAGSSLAAPSFIPFDSGPVRPVALSADGKQLFVTNISDNRLEILDVSGATPVVTHSVSVGLEPVAVSVLDDDTVVVANHLSDSVSVVNITGTPRVTHTLLVGDEPRDVLITDPDGTGPMAPRLFVTTAHRGQHRSHPSIADVPGAGDPELTTPGVGRADIWVFDTADLTSNDQGAETLGGHPLKIMSFFTDTPRALAKSPDGSHVYVAGFLSQNQTAVAGSGVVCPGFGDAEPCSTLDGWSAPDGAPEGYLPGGLPGPNTNAQGIAAPETGLILKWDPNAGPVDDDPTTGRFTDELGRDWNNGVRLRLPDKDVFAVDAQTLEEIAYHATVGTTLFNMVTNPQTGTLYVSNTDAQNHRRFEGAGDFAGQTVQGHLAESRITVINNPNHHQLNGDNVKPRHLNKHIDYQVLKAPQSVRERSLATPLEMVVTDDGSTLYVAAFGSQAVGFYDTAQLETDAFTPSNTQKIELTHGGPAGLALSPDQSRLYVYTRFDNGVSVIDTQSKQEIAHTALFNPEPAQVIAGRPLLYDARTSSSNGEASCSSCHIFGDNDGLAWDLGDPDAPVTESPLPVRLQRLIEINDQFGLTDILGGAGGLGNIDLEAINGGASMNQFHPMKGPMTTQTLRGMSTHGAMHWRGDRSTGFFNDDPDNPTLEEGFNEELSFKNFIVAFDGLNGRDGIISDDAMQSFSDFMLSVALPPNPVRAIDNSLTEAQKRGKNFYFGMPTGIEIGIARRRSDGVGPILEGLLNVIAGEQVEAGFTCEGCHRLDPENGFFGTDGQQSFEAELQIIKIPHLRNVYTKVGAFGVSPTSRNNADNNAEAADRFDFQGEQIKAFGLLHDGAEDTVESFISAQVFDDNGLGAGFQNRQQRLDVQEFMLAFDSDLAPVVGQQVTLNSTDSPAVERAQLLLKRADKTFKSKILGGTTKEADIVIKGVIDGSERGFLYTGRSFFGIPKFKSDKDERVWQLNSLINRFDGPVTFTAVPPGSGVRIGLDRDLDGTFNGQE